MAVNTHLGKVTNFNQVFDPNTLSYVPMVQPSTGGSGAGSTQVAVSSVAGVVKITPNDTSVAANAGFHFDGSGNLLTAGGSASTQITISRLLDSSNAAVGVADSLNNALRVNVVAGAAGGSSQVSIKEILTSSGGSVMDGTNVALRVNVVAGAAGGSTEATVRQSTYTDFNALSRLADRDQATQTAAVLGAAPASTSYGLVTRDLSTGPYVISSVGGVVTISTGPFVISSITGVSIVRPETGSTWAVRPLQSSAADLQMTATPAAGSTWNVRPLQSSAADLQVTATPAAGSTFNVRPLQSSAADLQATVTPVSGSTWNVRPLQSSQADLRITAYQSSAAEFKVTSFNADNAGNLIQSSTFAGSTGTSTMRGLAVRSCIPDCTNASAQAASSGDITVFSSAANTIYVYAYSLAVPPSSVAGPVTCRVLSGSTNQIWRVLLGSQVFGAGGASTANIAPISEQALAVAPPAYLFKTAASAALTLNATSSGVNYSFAAWRE